MGGGPASSYVLEVLLVPQQGLMLHVLVQIEARQPVLGLWLEDAEAGTFEELDEVQQGTPAEGALAPIRYEVVIAATVHPLVRCHSQTGYLKAQKRILVYYSGKGHFQFQTTIKRSTYLIHLANEQHEHPDAVEEGIGGDPGDPSVALSDSHDTLPEPVRGRGYVTGGFVLPVLHRTVQHLTAHYHQAGQEAYEVLVVLRSYKKIETYSVQHLP